MGQGALLLVDDDRHLLESMTGWLRGEGYAVKDAAGVGEAIDLVEQYEFDLVLSDIRLQDGDGFDVLQHCRDRHPELAVILLTGYGTVETGIEAIRAGAVDLLTKPLIDEELVMAIERALSERQLVRKIQGLDRKIKGLEVELDSRFGLDNVIGHDEQMLRIFDMIGSIADTKATVLITGESGTGKSLIARAIHRRSSRRDMPFVEVACGALPESLLESELFGHVAGAFTGAIGNKMGKFKQADTGTLFLDEIATASPGMQVKLLRVLQDLEFEPVGGSETCRIDTRVILATNEDLAQAVAGGRFRQDLYYRVNVINLELPALRERLADVPLLAQHFLKQVVEDSSRQVMGFTDEALAVLQSYHWPGNARELQNVVERAVLLGKDSVVTPADLPRHLCDGTPISAPSVAGHSLKEALEGPERQIILEVLQSNNWNRNLTAEQLGINRTTLYKKMKRLGLDQYASRCPTGPELH